MIIILSFAGPKGQIVPKQLHNQSGVFVCASGSGTIKVLNSIIKSLNGHSIVYSEREGRERERGREGGRKRERERGREGEREGGREGGRERGREGERERERERERDWYFFGYRAGLNTIIFDFVKEHRIIESKTETSWISGR